MTTHFPIVIEREKRDLWSAYVVGAPVYAQGGTRRQATDRIRATLAAMLADTPDATPGPDDTTILVAAVTRSAHRAPTVALVGIGALLGRRTSPRKAAAARRNGRLGGRPRAA